MEDNKPKVSITLKDYSYKCGDGCCLNYGTITTVNGKELECHNQDRYTILKIVLEELGYDVQIEEYYDY